MIPVLLVLDDADDVEDVDELADELAELATLDELDEAEALTELVALEELEVETLILDDDVDKEAEDEKPELLPLDPPPPPQPNNTTDANEMMLTRFKFFTDVLPFGVPAENRPDVINAT